MARSTRETTSTVRLQPAASFALLELAELFTAAFEGYLAPIRMDEAGLRTMVHALDIDLDASRVAVADGDPAGLVLLGVRGDEGWVGGMGVVPRRRRQGVGVALMDGLLDEARRRAVRVVRLEVIDRNEPALRLYEGLGFEHERDVEVWSLAAGEDEASVREASVDEALERTRALRREREPWQRDDATVRRLGEFDPPPRAFVADGGAAIFRASGPAVSLLQLEAESDDAAVTLVRAVRAEGTGLHSLNLPHGHPAALALGALGGRVDFVQHELALELQPV
jgi:ribosomal protein S18 acetylase RimI-like enzyme